MRTKSKSSSIIEGLRAARVRGRGVPVAKKKVSRSHPGSILREHFIRARGVTPYRVAKEIGVPLPRLNDIVREKRNISMEMGVMLARYFGTSEDFFTNLQSDYDRQNAQVALRDKLASIVPLATRRP